MENRTAKPLEFTYFRQYHVAIKKWLSENAYLRNYPDDANIRVDYLVPEAAWAKYIFPVTNGESLQPNLTFSLEDANYKESENLLGFVRETKLNAKGKFDSRKPPLVYELKYKCVLATKTMGESDMVKYQLSNIAHKNKKAFVKVDGQWCEIYVDSWSDDMELEPGEIQDRITKYSFTLTVPRAYLPMDYLEDAFTRIESIEVDVEVKSEEEAAQELTDLLESELEESDITVNQEDGKVTIGEKI